jgi:hypothetical protein
MILSQVLGQSRCHAFQWNPKDNRTQVTPLMICSRSQTPRDLLPKPADKEAVTSMAETAETENDMSVISKMHGGVFQGD